MDKKSFASINSFMKTSLSLFRKITSHHIIGPFTVLIFIYLIFSIGTGGKFISPKNLYTILSLAGMLIIMAMGSSMVLLIGSIDLSLEGVTALTSMIIGLLIKNSFTQMDLGLWVFPIAMLVGGLVGFINGFIVTRMKIPSLIVTLGVWYGAFGLATIIGKGATIQILDKRFQFLANGSIAGIPCITIIALVIFFIIFLIQKKTLLGRHIYAVGGNETLAKMAGINVNKIKIVVFTISGMIYGIASFLLVSRLLAASTIIAKRHLQ